MMKLWVKRGTATLAVLVIGLVALRWLPQDAGARERRSSREIVLVARQMAFFIDGDRSPNPRLQLHAGERVRLVLRNEEPGVTHNFAVPSWNLATNELQGSGSEAIEFVVPDRPGVSEYECTPHSVMMRGTIEIR